MNKRTKKLEKGITLIALIITIIVLLILAGVTIASLTGENGLLNKAVTAKEATERAGIIEQIQIDILNKQAGNPSGDLTQDGLKTILTNYVENSETDIKYDEIDTSKIVSIITKRGKYTILISEILGEITVSGGTEETPSTPEEPTVPILTGLEASDITVEKGETTTITVTKTPSDVTEELSYVSSDENIAIVDESGVVTGVEAGTATITITGKTTTSVTTTCTVTVTTPEPVADGSWNETAKVNVPKSTNINDVKYVTWTENSGTYTINDTQTEIPEGWYDYENGKWANIKTTGNGYNAYWVWIPRYEYVVPTSTTATQIEVKFIPTTQTTADDGYTIHPAFTFNGQQLAGIWVAKFEASSSSPSSSYGGGDSTSLNVQVLPNVTSWRKITTNNIFTVCRNIQTGGTLGTVSDTVVNSHMMKNIEWGAVAILSQSKYGIYNPSSKTGLTTNGGDGTLQVWNNPYYTSTNTVLKTGYVSSSTSGKDATSTTSCDEYNTGNGPKGSTTGTVYGVYDMAGGAYEYVAGCISGYEDTKFGVTEGDSTYVDLYTNASNSNSDYTGAITGDATTETKGWNDDYSHFVYSSRPVFYRGGAYDNGTGAGVFYFSSFDGSANYGIGFRVVLAAF